MGFAGERRVKAVRKPRLCDGCGKMIEFGQPATCWAGMVEGEFGAASYHPECRKAEVELNDLRGWLWGDEWTPLGEIDRNDWPWLIDAHPQVADRMNIRAAIKDTEHGA